MTCYHPSYVPVRRKSSYPGQRLSYMQEVNCGKCLGCRAKYSRDWAMRILHESYLHQSRFFLTLTYETMPEGGSLVRKDFTDWLKRLRKKKKDRFRYFGCGEYGDKSIRPHYHAILLGDNLFLDRRLIGVRNGIKLYQSDMLDSTWDKGFIELAGMSQGAANYIAGYVRKKLAKADNPNRYERVDGKTGEIFEVEQEFSSMSRNPAIGLNWIRRTWRAVYPRDILTMNGYEFRPPRYYDKWMDDDHSLKKNHPDCPGGCDEHRSVMPEVREKRWAQRYEFEKRELRAMEKHHKKRMKLFSERSGI